MSAKPSKTAKPVKSTKAAGSVKNSQSTKAAQAAKAAKAAKAASTLKNAFKQIAEDDRWGHYLGIEFVEITELGVKAILDAGAKHQQPMGILHGGVWCSIVETAASYGAGYLAMSLGARGVVGVSNQTDFLRSHSEGRLEVVAHPLHAGRRSHLWEVLITRPSDSALVARGQVRFQVIDQLPAERDSANAPHTTPGKA